MAKGSDNPFPSVLVVEGTVPSSPAAGRQRVYIDSADNTLKSVNSSGAVTMAGAIRQVKNTQTGALATGTTLIPVDDTIPQNTEGTELMTLAITPTDSGNKLKIEVVVMASYSVQAWMTAALFQDATANALATGSLFVAAASGSVGAIISFTHYMDAGTTSATTFKIRGGGHTAGTFTFNGSGAGAALYGGTFASSITITEIVP
jgi:hypothetical protein